VKIIASGDGADRRKKRIDNIRAYIKRSGTNGRALHSIIKYAVGNFGLTRKTAERLIKDMEYAGFIKIGRDGRVFEKD